MTQIAFFRRDAVRVIFSGDYATFTETDTTDICILGRDITNLFPLKAALNTNKDDKAMYVRDSNKFEEVIRPFRKTVTLIDLTWAILDLNADGYDPIQKMWLHDAKYENKGYSRSIERLQVQFNIPVRKRANY